MGLGSGIEEAKTGRHLRRRMRRERNVSDAFIERTVPFVVMKFNHRDFLPQDRLHN
jgi:hypothetical protein